MFCKVRKSIKEYREWQMKIYTRVEDTLEQRLAGVIAAKQKLAEQMERDTVNTTETVTSPLDPVIDSLYYTINWHTAECDSCINNFIQRTRNNRNPA